MSESRAHIGKDIKRVDKKSITRMTVMQEDNEGEININTSGTSGLYREHLDDNSTNKDVPPLARLEAAINEEKEIKEI